MRRTLAIAISLALAATTLDATAQAQDTANPPRVEATTQLPRNVRPTHYDVSITPHAQSLSFDGTAVIALDVLDPTDRIVLNALDMRFASATLAPAEGGTAIPAQVSVDADAQTATFRFPEPLRVGSYRLSLDYSGLIGTQANGLFAIDYSTDAGEKRALYTQFENSDARRFVPSWDEPNYKATFTLSATVPSAQMAVSNMPAAETTDLGNGLKRVRFAQSPKMSTYLLFFGLGDFDRATTMADGVEVGVVTQKGKADQSRFALESAAAVLREYNDYFGVPYPLPKLDNIASPGRSQFFSAMENWGAIYTFEYAQLLDPRISTDLDKQRIFSTGAHEIAHQWFGDLVTMSWWDDLWLNEGFASWMESRMTAKLHPEWKTAMGSVIGARESAMGRDAVATTHPVVQHVETVEQASQAFDSITYSKGEAVIRMLEAYTGADTWREGVRTYIKAHAYGNSVSDDLWQAMESVSDKPIMQIAHDFTLQPGVPLIRVDAAQCTGGNTTVQLSQGEFTRDRPDKTPLSWHVPVVAQVVGSAPVRAVVDGTATLQLPGCGAFVVNAGQTGYYRSLYAPAQLATLRDAFATLEPVDQLGLMNDVWSLGMAGYEPASDYLDLAARVPADADPQILREVVGSLGGIDGMYRGDDAGQARFREFALAKLRPMFAAIGWEERPGDSDPVKRLRTSLIGTLSSLGDAGVIAEARRRYAASETDPDAMPVALRRTILGIVADHADAATWDKLHAQAKAETTPLIKDQLYSLLASAKDEALAKRALELALTDEPGATNSAGMISYVSYEHPDMAFDFAVAHREQVDKLVDSTSRSRFYPGLGSSSRDPGMIAKLNAFADAHIAASSRRATDTAIASIEYRREVVEKRLPQITAWLEAQR
jgi:aminopeptidase N